MKTAYLSSSLAMMSLMEDKTIFPSIPTYPIKNDMLDIPAIAFTLDRNQSFYSKKKKPNKGFSIGSYIEVDNLFIII
jgi:hypothetical protein